MNIRLAIYFIFLLFFFEILAFTSVSWSFYESTQSSIQMLKYVSDNRARDVLATIARVAENKMNHNGLYEMNQYFMKMIRQSESDLDKNTIREVFIISIDGKVLSHNDPAEVAIELDKRPISLKYNKPFFTRALRMRKGQLPVPQNYGNKYVGDGTFWSKTFIKYFPEIQNQTIVLSAPIYYPDKLETMASIHLIYQRGNLIQFLEKQKDLLIWMSLNYGIIALVMTLISWGIFLFMNFMTLKEGLKQDYEASDVESSISDEEISSKKSISLGKAISNIFHPTGGSSKSKKIQPIAVTNPMNNIASTEDNLVPSPTTNGKKDDKSKEVLDAIYLD